MNTLKLYWKILKETVQQYIDDDIFTHAAALAYYTIFSLPPMLLIILFTTTRFYDEAVIKQTLLKQIGELVGNDGATQLLATIERLDIFKPTIWATILGLSILIFTSTTVFVTMQNTLNKIFRVEPKPRTNFGLLNMLIDRLLSFSLLIGLAFILLVSLTINALLVSFANFLEEWLGIVSTVFTLFTSILLPIIVITFFFAMIFKILPDAKLGWRDTWFGALVTCLLFVMGKYLISLYIGNSDIAGVYDAAGSIMVIMVWIFYASLIFLFGAVFTYVRTKEFNDKVRASDFAVKVHYKKVEKPRLPLED